MTRWHAELLGNLLCVPEPGRTQKQPTTRLKRSTRASVRNFSISPPEPPLANQLMATNNETVLIFTRGW